MARLLLPDDLMMIMKVDESTRPSLLLTNSSAIGGNPPALVAPCCLCLYGGDGCGWAGVGVVAGVSIPMMFPLFCRLRAQFRAAAFCFL